MVREIIFKRKLYEGFLCIALKNKTIHKIFVKDENGFLLQATCFPVGER